MVTRFRKIWVRLCNIGTHIDIAVQNFAQHAANPAPKPMERVLIAGKKYKVISFNRLAMQTRTPYNLTVAEYIRLENGQEKEGKHIQCIARGDQVVVEGEVFLAKWMGAVFILMPTRTQRYDEYDRYRLSLDVIEEQVAAQDSARLAKGPTS